MSVDVPGLVKQLRTLKSSDLQDEAGRQSLFEAVRTIAAALETPGDAVNRIAHTVYVSTTTTIYTPVLIIMTSFSLFKLSRLGLPAISTCLRP